MIRNARAVGAGLAGAALILPASKVYCAEKDPAQAPHYPWWFKSMFHSHDIPSVRRGYEVYRQVCATCHSMKQLHFRHLSNQVLPELRMKQIAADYDVSDGPNDEGEMFTRPGIVQDQFPMPYPNEQAARFANNGACPPDLSVFCSATHEGCDYVMALLTGYREPPAGLNLRAGLYYNPYFHGGLIGMPPPLNIGVLEYEDGTPATVSQMAKDCVNFMCWACEPQHDERKLLCMKAWTASVMATIFMGVYYRATWMTLKTRRIDFNKAVLR